MLVEAQDVDVAIVAFDLEVTIINSVPLVAVSTISTLR
jgi:hypothetical protein